MDIPWHKKGNAAYNRSVDSLNKMYKDAAIAETLVRKRSIRERFERIICGGE